MLEELARTELARTEVPVIQFNGTFKEADEIIRKGFKNFILDSEVQCSYDCFQHLKSNGRFETRVACYYCNGELMYETTRFGTFEEQLRAYLKNSNPPYCIITRERFEEAVNIVNEFAAKLDVK